ncbi:MAG: hypothetical protein MN733_20600 [Nitrososphaera sp.]|nr:hypothetical protein [Nitrososphaera sp.]
MSSRTFPAKTTHSKANPQVCGLHNVTGCDSPIDGKPVPGAIRAGQQCFYLTCRGDDAKPATQIEGSNQKDDYETGYRQCPSGKHREVGSCRRKHTSQDDCDKNGCHLGRWYRKKIFKWQEWSCPISCGTTPVECGRASHNGGWHDVEVWERMVHLICADQAGYSVPGGQTEAHKGSRTIGTAHRVSSVAESPLMDLGRILEDDND